MQEWVSPTGVPHDIADEELSAFCKRQTPKLKYGNMKHHVDSARSDQKENGWRLVERLRAIGHIDRPDEHVLALGTLDMFHQDCLASSDGRNVLKNRDSLRKLLAGTYNGGGGVPWLGWELRALSVAEKKQLLLRRLGHAESGEERMGEQRDEPQLIDYGAAAELLAAPPFQSARGASSICSPPSSLGACFTVLDPHARTRDRPKKPEPHAISRASPLTDSDRSLMVAGTATGCGGGACGASSFCSELAREGACLVPLEPRARARDGTNKPEPKPIPHTHVMIDFGRLSC
jgi:hypothetical protein